jgi:2-polyprenyl-6-methoxyphenol hydroxylase-like FAD-dependent oxidoreductase
MPVVRATPMPPALMLGQGASKAIEGALVLAACLDAENHFGAAFPRYRTLHRSGTGQL